ncbi:MAG: L,D-transpeptidase family protein [Bacteroidaceae bacterium]|nr:L,D-transpeptidase family protein [Bacteroidaceae bacterium]
MPISNLQGKKRRPTLIGALTIMLLSACTSIFGPTEAELSAFGEYVYRIDSLQLNEQLNHILNEDKLQNNTRTVVHQYYKGKIDTGQPMLWITRMGVDSDADALLTQLRREIPLAGLDTAAFHLTEIAQDLNVIHTLAFDSLGIDINTLLPRLDYNLSQAYVCYAIGQRYGFVNPDKLLNQLDFNEELQSYTRLFDYDVKTPDYEEAIHHLTSDERMDYLRQSSPNDSVYLKLQDRLSASTDVAERHKLAINMERCRWQLKKPQADERRVLVNLPAQQLWAMCPDTIINMRICFGKKSTKTPLLASGISRIDVNPDWIITPNIIKNEVSVHAGDSAYFARNRYYIVNLNSGDTLNPAHVSMSQLQSGTLRVGQRGGAGNSLGRIVFRFPNNFSVYLHDTSNRGAFDLAQRALSHGCIRVQKPFDLALFALPDLEEWDADRLRISMDIKPITEQGMQYLEEHRDDPRPLRLIRQQTVTPSLPIYIIYFTAYPNPESGAVEYWSDPYGYDAVIAATHPCMLR